MKKILRLINKVPSLIIGVIILIHTKAVHAMVVYAPPGGFNQKANTLHDFITEYTGLAIFISLLALVGLITIIRLIIIKIFRRRK